MTINIGPCVIQFVMLLSTIFAKNALPKENTTYGPMEDDAKPEEKTALYSVKEAAEKLSVSEDTIRTRIKSGKLSAKKRKKVSGLFPVLIKKGE